MVLGEVKEDRLDQLDHLKIFIYLNAISTVAQQKISINLNSAYFTIQWNLSIRLLGNMSNLVHVLFE